MVNFVYKGRINTYKIYKVLGFPMKLKQIHLCLIQTLNLSDDNLLYEPLDQGSTPALILFFATFFVWKNVWSKMRKTFESFSSSSLL